MDRAEPHALQGLKVADFTWAVAGPMVTRTFAAHGATVVRVESAAHPDSIRLGAPFAEGKPGINRSGFFAEFNTGKYGLALDLTRPEARPVARRLVEWADVVIESFSPRVMEKWGLGYAQISQYKPGIIMLSTCMQGQTGPYRDYRGYGGQAAAIAGLHYLTGWPDLVPSGPRGPYTDSIAPKYGVAAILAAMDHRERTGRGQHIDLSQIEAGTHFIAPQILEFTANGQVSQRLGNRSPAVAPHGAFPCLGEDRWITIVVESDAAWARLCALMGQPEWATDARFAENAARLANVDALEQGIAQWTATQQPLMAVNALQAAGIAAGLVEKVSDLFSDPQLAHRGQFVPLDHAEMGRFKYGGSPTQFSATPAELRWGAHLLGEHTETVLRDFLGYSDAEIEGLSAGGLLK